MPKVKNRQILAFCSLKRHRRVTPRFRRLHACRSRPMPDSPRDGNCCIPIQLVYPGYTPCGPNEARPSLRWLRHTFVTCYVGYRTDENLRWPQNSYSTPSYQTSSSGRHDTSRLPNRKREPNRRTSVASQWPRRIFRCQQRNCGCDGREEYDHPAGRGNSSCARPHGGGYFPEVGNTIK